MNTQHVYTSFLRAKCARVCQVSFFFLTKYSSTRALVLRNLQGFPLRLGNFCRVFQTRGFVDRGKFLKLLCSLGLPLGTIL